MFLKNCDSSFFINANGELPDALNDAMARTCVFSVLEGISSLSKAAATCPQSFSIELHNIEGMLRAYWMMYIYRTSDTLNLIPHI